MRGDPQQTPGAAGSDDAVALRERRVARAFVSLADTMVDDFDPSEFPHVLVEHCVDLLEVDAAGVLLRDRRGGVRVAAAPSDKAELLELFGAEPAGVRPTSAHLGQALVDVATIAILRQRSIGVAEGLAGQVQTALNARAIIAHHAGRA